MYVFNFKDFWECHFKSYYKYYIIFGIFIFTGIIIGIISGVNISKDISTYITLVFFKRIYIETKLFMAYFVNLVIITLLYGLCLLFCINIYLFPLAFIFAIYRGYLTGFTAVAIIKIYGGGAIINLIVVFIPFQLLMFFFLIAGLSVCARRLLNNRRCPPFEFRGVDYCCTLQELGILLAMAAIFSLGLTILVAIMTKGFSIVF